MLILAHRAKTREVKTRNERFVFYIIVTAQFCGTSLWFAGNAVLPQLQLEFHWPQNYLGYLTSSIQGGFIAGTLCFAVLGLADRFSPSKLFLISSLIAAGTNAVALADLSSFPLVLTSRFLTGFFLAGIYPVGMKIASDWRKEGLGMWLGGLVGALVLGTSFPHLLKEFPLVNRAGTVVTIVTGLAVFGGVFLYLLVPNGPYRKPPTKFSFAAVGKAFRFPSFRNAALGYFGHMWELYAMWAFVPYFIFEYQKFNQSSLSVPLLSFIVIGAGALGCVTGGHLSRAVGSEVVARYMLISSGLCCILSCFVFSSVTWLFITFMLFWGFTVAGDSPQFSALVANYARPEVRGSAITMVICIGFFISIISIQLLNFVQDIIAVKYLFVLLLPGPVFGVITMGSRPFTSPL